MSSKPLLTVGLPTYNGADSIGNALTTLIDQDFGDFELHISDNGSTDNTPQICEEFARVDSRVHYHRIPVNQGAVANFNNAFSFCRTEYFMFASDDDLREPTFLSDCLDELRRTPEGVLAFSYFDTIAPDGQRGPAIDDQMKTVGLDQRARLSYVIAHLNWCSAIFGVVRAKALRQTRMFRNIWGADLALLYQLSLCGSFIKIPRVLYHRVLPGGSEISARQQWNAYQPSNPNRRLFLPEVWLLTELLTYIARFDESPNQRLRLVLDVLLFSVQRRLRYRRIA